MPCSPLMRCRGLAFTLLALGGVLAYSQPVFGQGGPQIMVIDDNGDGPTMSHFSMPNLIEIRQPDFVKRDLPIFTEKLVLSEAQTTAFERQIELYLEKFAALCKQHLEVAGEMPVLTLGPGSLRRPEDLGEDEDASDLPMVMLEDGEMGDLLAEGMQMEVGVRMQAPGGEGEEGGDEGGAAPAAPAQPSVAVSFQGRNGEELPEEVRQELEKRAAEMAEKIKQQVEQQMAEGGNPNEIPAIPGMGVARVEDLKKRQEEMAAASEALRKDKVNLRQQFVAEAHTKLTTDQIERWPALERAVLREKSLPTGRLSGERTNLFKVLKKIDVNPANLNSVSEQLDNYDLALDAALRQRNEYLEDSNAKIDKAMQEKNFDRALSVIDRAAALRVAVRAVNEQFADTIAQAMPEDIGQAFRDAVIKAAYPQIYRPTLAQRTFVAARKIEGVDESTVVSLGELERAYQIELEEMNVRLRRAIDKHQPAEPRRPIEHMKAIAAGAAPVEAARLNHDDPISEAFAKRRELDERFVKSITSLLTPEQVAQLPKAPARRKMGEPFIIQRTAGE